MGNILFGAIVVLYNPYEKEYQNILSYGSLVDHLLILDNSENNHHEEVNRVTKQLDVSSEYIQFKKNIGLSKALNYGIKKIRHKKCDWVLIMDADSSLNSNIIDIYTEYINNNSVNKVALLAPVHITDRKKVDFFNGSHEIEWSMTSGCLFNLEIFSDLGGFNESLFIDGLDIDYCYHAREKGYKIIQCGMAKLNHVPAETQNISFMGIEILRYGKASSFRYYLQAESIIWNLFRYGKKKELVRYLSKWFKVIFLFESKKEYISEMKKGTAEGFKLWKNYKKRQKSYQE